MVLCDDYIPDILANQDGRSEDKVIRSPSN